MTDLLQKKGYFLKYQNDWILDDGDALLWDKSRRIGATYSESYKSVRKRNLIDYRRDHFFTSADESAAVEFALYCRQWAEIAEAAAKEVLETLEDDKGYKYNNYVIVFPNGSRINCMTSNPRRFRSKGGDVTLDEFDWHDDPGMMLDAALPATTWGYKISILTTRNGEGTPFDKLVKTAKRIVSGEATAEQLNSLDWHYHLTPITTAIDQGLAEKVYKIDHVDLAARKKFFNSCRARARNQDAFNQEYMCIPSASAMCLIPYDMYQACEMADCMTKIGSGPKFLGIDVGREKDLTKFWVWELVADLLITRKVITLRKMPYNVQLKTASDLLSDRSIIKCCGDATGIGDMLIESLQDRFGTGRIEKVKFTAAIKEHLASQMLGRFEDKRVRVPDDTDIRESFHSVRKTVTATGNIRFDAAHTDLGHADDFWAAALGIEAASNNADKPEIITLG